MAKEKQRAMNCEQIQVLVRSDKEREQCGRPRPAIPGKVHPENITNIIK